MPHSISYEYFTGKCDTHQLSSKSKWI